jgi:hypothetical protein
MAEAQGGEESPVVRISSAKVAKSSVPSFLQTYNLLLLPILRSSPACTGAQLMVARKSDQQVERENDEAAQTQGGTADTGPETITVTSMTYWSDEGSMDRMSSDPSYAQAMNQLATYMRGGRAGSSTRVMHAASGLGHGQEPAPGPELGLR